MTADRRATGPTTSDAAAAASEDSASRVNRPAAVVRLLRPRQWAKNVLVAAAPLAAALAPTAATVATVGATFVAFSLAASAGYVLNDLRDVAADRQHPTKRLRPLASGEVSTTVAWVAAAVCLASSLLLAAVVNVALVLVVVGYLALTAAYSLALKTEPVLDLAAVCGGFVLRAVAGSVAVGVPLSTWFLLVASFGSLFMVTGKRYAEAHRRERPDATASSPGTAMLRPEEPDGMGSDRAPEYSMSYLRMVLTIAATCTIVFYALWSVVVAGGRTQTWSTLSVAPFALAILRYGVDVDRGVAGAPEDVVLRDWGLQLLALVWLATFAAAAYGA